MIPRSTIPSRCTPRHYNHPQHTGDGDKHSGRWSCLVRAALVYNDMPCHTPRLPDVIPALMMSASIYIQPLGSPRANAVSIYIYIQPLGSPRANAVSINIYTLGSPWANIVSINIYTLGSPWANIVSINVYTLGSTWANTVSAHQYIHGRITLSYHKILLNYSFTKGFIHLC